MTPVENKSGAVEIHFPGLNGLRFLAAYSVIIHHIEFFKLKAGLSNVAQLPAIQALGRYGVVCFFVLSGFLITFLLLREREQTGGIRIGRFYVRRILRIWPLYYFVLALGAVAALNLSGFGDLDGMFDGYLGAKLALYVFFLPNLAAAFLGAVPFLGPLWSVGVEEQFYLMWPVVLKWFGRSCAVFMALFILFFILVRVFQDYLFTSELVKTFLFMLRLECMALGGLAAWVLHERKEKILNIVYQRGCQLLLLLGLGLSLAFNPDYGAFDNLVYGLLFGALILNLVSNRSSYIKLEGPVLDYLGRISYGLYMYHSLVIVAVLELMLLMHVRDGAAGTVLLYALSTCFTIAAASVSYFGFEQRFLSLKKRFTVVGSSAGRLEASAR